MRLASFAMLLCSLAASADEWPAPGAEARRFNCGPTKWFTVSTFIWEVNDTGRPVLHEYAGETGEPPTEHRGPKPKPGYLFGLPLSSADWGLKSVESWARQADGSWVNSKGKEAKLECSKRVLRAMHERIESENDCGGGGDWRTEK